jgi:hypothetical protein
VADERRRPLRGARHRLATAAAAVRARRLARARARLERLAPGSVLLTEYPVRPAARYGWAGRPPHPALESHFAADRARYHAILAGFEAHLLPLRAIGRHPEPGVPGWDNDYFTGIDAVALYGFLAERSPARYVEVGSGHSTTFARRAITDLGLPTRITSIDPAPRADVDALCDEVLRCGLEEVGAAPFADLAAGDVVLLDGSHLSLMGSDVTVAFLEVLPALPRGVLVCIDDVFLPWDYPPDWVGRWYAEQYLLATLLLAPDPGWDVVLPDFWLSQDPDSVAALQPFDDPARTKFGLAGVSMWLERG